MARTPEFVDSILEELQTAIVDIRGVLYGDKRKNESAGLVQAVTEITKLGEERDRRLERIEQMVSGTAEATARIEAQLQPVVHRAESMQRNTTSHALTNIALVLWVMALSAPVILVDWNHPILAHPLGRFAILALAAGICTGLALALRKNGGH